VLLSGHVCPAHKVEPGRFGLVEVAPAAPAQASVPPAPQPVIPKNQAPAAPTAAAAQNPATPTVRRKEP
jgi:hypothetical protein